MQLWFIYLFIYFKNRVTNYLGYFAKVWKRKKSEKHQLALFNLFGKGDAAYYFLCSYSCL